MRVDGEEIIITVENAEKAINNAVINTLDKIRAEIAEEAKCTMNGNRAGGLYKALQIIDKYRAETE